MSVHDIKARCSDVAGIQSLNMRVESGKLSFTWGEGFAAAVDVTASDAECETAIRNAAKLPPITLIFDKPAPAPAPGPVASPAAAVINPADAMAALDRSMAGHVQMMQDLIGSQVRMIEAKQARQRETIGKHLSAFGDRLDAQTDAFDAMMSRYTNGGPV